MSRAKMVVAGILLVLVSVLVFQNQETATTRLWLWTVELPRFALLGLVFLGGLVTGYILGWNLRVQFGGRSRRSSPPR